MARKVRRKVRKAPLPPAPVKKRRKVKKVVAKKQRKAAKLPKSPQTFEEAVKQVGPSILKAKGQLRLPSAVQARLQAQLDYVSDPARQPVVWHYERKDRNYSELIKFKKFQEWAKLDSWDDERELYWSNVQKTMLQRLQDRQVQAHLLEIDQLSEVEKNLFHYLLPLKDVEGNVKLDEKTGLPEFALELGSYSKALKAFLDITARKSALRGDVLHRTDLVARESRASRDGKADSEASKFPAHEAAMLALALIENRDPRLKEAVALVEAQGESADDE